MSGEDGGNALIRDVPGCSGVAMGEVGAAANVLPKLA